MPFLKLKYGFFLLILNKGSSCIDYFLIDEILFDDSVLSIVVLQSFAFTSSCTFNNC